MAQSKDGTKRRTVIIAVDGSDNSKAAFQGKMFANNLALCLT